MNVLAIAVLTAFAVLAAWYYSGLFAMTKETRREFKKREAADIQKW